LEQTSLEVAEAVDRTAKDTRHDERRTSTTYSVGCWVTEILFR
jgi:hypothetical protein